MMRATSVVHHRGGIVAAWENSATISSKCRNDCKAEHHPTHKKTTVKTWRYAQVLSNCPAVAPRSPPPCGAGAQLRREQKNATVPCPSTALSTARVPENILSRTAHCRDARAAAAVSLAVSLARHIGDSLVGAALFPAIRTSHLLFRA
jgi:hypothetical protein